MLPIPRMSQRMNPEVGASCDVTCGQFMSRMIEIDAA
jgi:hypothetical protein